MRSTCPCQVHGGPLPADGCWHAASPAPLQQCWKTNEARARSVARCRAASSASYHRGASPPPDGAGARFLARPGLPCWLRSQRCSRAEPAGYQHTTPLRAQLNLATAGADRKETAIFAAWAVHCRASSPWSRCRRCRHGLLQSPPPSCGSSSSGESVPNAADVGTEAWPGLWLVLGDGTIQSSVAVRPALLLAAWRAAAVERPGTVCPAGSRMPSSWLPTTAQSRLRRA